MSSKTKTDSSLSARRERAIKRQESAAATLKSIAEAERRARTRRLIVLGAAVDRAGLADLHEDVLLGALISLQAARSTPTWPDREQSMREVGAHHRAERKAAKSGVPVSIQLLPGVDADPAARKDLRAAGLRHVPELGVWVGTVDLEHVSVIVLRYGGELTRRD